MKTGLRKRFVVTKKSNNGTFIRGDHVIFDNGSIICIEAEGWVDKEDVPKATAGWEITEDTEWKEKQINYIRRIENEF